MGRQETVLDAERIERVLTRIAHEILERNKNAANVVLVGIRKGGEEIARRIAEQLRRIESSEIRLGFLDITLYRDDLHTARGYPVVGRTEIPFSIADKDVVLIDDVLFTGRTVRAAMEGLLAFGRPRTIQCAVLIDRGHRELPIHADYVGREITTRRDQQVRVVLGPDPTADAVLVVDPD